METKRKSNGGVILFLLLFFGMLGWLLVRGETHADTKHIEAPIIRDAYKDSTCEGVEMWFSPSRGTILILCGLPESSLWGGLIFRVTENNGQVWLGDEAYECSAFAAKRSYWTNVIERDEYMPIMNFPKIERTFRDWYN